MIHRFNGHARLRCDAIGCAENDAFPISTSAAQIEDWATSNGWRAYERCGETRHICSRCVSVKMWRAA